MMSFDYVPPEDLQNILKDPSCTLEKVLDHDLVLDELKHRNETLIKYLCQDETMKRLVSYIVEFPENLDYDPYHSNRDQVINKFPLVATELLSTENEELLCKMLGLEYADKAEEILEEFINQSEYGDEIEGPPLDQVYRDDSIAKNLPIYRLFKFLDTDLPLNFTQANYFSRVTKNLLFNSPIATSLYIFRIHFEFFKKITSHVYCDSIHEILSTIIKLEPSYFRLKKKSHYTDLRLQLVSQLVENIYNSKSKLDEHYVLDNMVNSANLVGSLIVQNAIVVDGRKILNYLISKETLDKIFGGITDQVQVICSCNLIIQLCDYFTEAYAPKSNRPILDLTNFVSVVLPPEFKDDDLFLVRVIASVPKITEILKYNPRTSDRSKWPSSITRLKLLDVVFSYVKLKNKLLDAAIAKSDLIPAILEILGYDIWSNILHHVVVKILIYIINECSDTLKQDLFEKSKAMDFILEALKELNTRMPSKKQSTSIEKGNIPHLILLGNAIKNSESNYIIDKTSSHSGWTAFILGLLQDRNARNTAKIGGEPDHTKRFKIKMKVDEEEMGPVTQAKDKIEEEAKQTERNLLRRSSKSFEEIIIEETQLKKPEGNKLPGIGLSFDAFGANNANNDSSGSSSGSGSGSGSDDDEEEGDGSPKTPHKNKGNSVGFDSF